MQMARQDPERFYKETIESLVQVNNEDRLTLFTLLSILLDYMGGNVTTDNVRSHLLVVKNIANRYNVKDRQDLQKEVEDSARNVQAQRYSSLPILGGLQ